tara:strand:- start:34 stop:171 length:138 start_codon:yes stop_codon:yes gene_type:complete
LEPQAALVVVVMLLLAGKVMVVMVWSTLVQAEELPHSHLAGLQVY